MKKLITLALALILTLAASLSAAAESSALDAFRQLTGEDAGQTSGTAKTSEQYLNEVMQGNYASAFLDTATAQTAAGELDGLSAVTTQDIAAYAAAHGLSVAQVRNAYYRALANVLRAEIMVNPASEERYRNVQVILSLFLETDDDPADDASRDAIRRSMTPEYAASIAADYDLPTGFVEFIIMDDDWDDDDWENDGWDDDADDTWAWSAADDGASLGVGSRDDSASFRVAELQERLIALGYLEGKADGIFGQRTQAALREFQLANGLAPTGSYAEDDARRLFADDVVARWDYIEDFYDTDDDDDYYDGLYGGTDDDDYDDTYDDYSDSPDYSASPDYSSSPDYSDSPDYSSSPDYSDSPDYSSSPDYSDSPDYSSSPDYSDSPDYDSSPDYDDSSDDDDYEDSDD